MDGKVKACFIAALVLISCAGVACDSETTTADSAAEDMAGDTEDAQVDAPPDVSDVSEDPDQEECPMLPPGCIDSCRDENGDEVQTLGVSARRCEVVTDEHGCPALSFTDEDCGEGTCVWQEGSVECLPPVSCESAECSCPPDTACSCALDDCSVSCEDHCIVSINGENGTVECQDGSMCRVVCNGVNCGTNCGSGGRCTQECNSAGCLLDCDGASECSQECNVLPEDCTCNGCS